MTSWTMTGRGDSDAATGVVGGMRGDEDAAIGQSVQLPRGRRGPDPSQMGHVGPAPRITQTTGSGPMHGDPGDGRDG